MASEITELLQIKNRILGVLLSDARKSSGRESTDCAKLLGIDEKTYSAFEMGIESPSLAQLEILAYVFNLPITHFWGGQTLEAQQRETEIQDRVPELIMLQQRVMGIKLRQLRDKAGFTTEQVAEKTGFSEDDIKSIELGVLPYPVHKIEIIVRALQGRLSDLSDGHGPVGNWLQAKEDFDDFLKIPPEIREFLLKPINRSYIDLAIRLSEMKVNKLRDIAEGILEITY